MSLLADTRLLGLYAGIPTPTPGYIFLQTGQAGTLSAYFQYLTGSAPLFTLNGKVLYSNTGEPSSSIGSSGDFFISENLYKFYGPKQGTGAWPSGVELRVTGLQGPSGASTVGLQGTGVAPSGRTNQILTKSSDSSYDTSWKSVGDVLRGTYSRFGGRPSQFREVYRNLGLRGVSGSTPSNDLGSGCTYNPLTNTLFIADNGTPSITEYGLDGQYVRTINLSGFKDIEAIDFMYGQSDGIPYSTFVIAEEYNASGAAYLNKLHVIRIPYSGNITITNNPGVDDHIREIDLSAYLTNAAPNIGIEGVAYNQDEDIFYVITEKTANEGWFVWRVNNDSIITITELFDLAAALSILSPPATDISDICYRRNTNSLVLVSEEGAGYILEFDLAGGLLDYIAAPSAFFQLEGVCFSPNGKLMFLTGEANTVGGDKPDYIMYAWDDGQNPTTDERTHGLNYFQNGIATSLKGKIFELADPYFTSTNNTNQSLTVAWPYGSRNLHSDMIKRGKKIYFSAFGDFIPNTPTTGTAILAFQVQDSGDAALTPIVTVTGISCHATNYWNYEGRVAFSESGFYNNSKVEISNASGYWSKLQLCQSGLSSAFTSGDIDFVTKFNVPSTTGTLNIYQFSIEID